VNVKPSPKCVIDRSRPCNACIAPDPRSCPYPYLLAGEKAAGGADPEGEEPSARTAGDDGPPPTSP
jgi:hypothetical protein